MNGSYKKPYLYQKELPTVYRVVFFCVGIYKNSRGGEHRGVGLGAHTINHSQEAFVKTEHRSIVSQAASGADPLNPITGGGSRGLTTCHYASRNYKQLA